MDEDCDNQILPCALLDVPELHLPAPLTICYVSYSMEAVIYPFQFQQMILRATFFVNMKMPFSPNCYQFFFHPVYQIQHH